MNNPYENNEQPLECAGCADEATMTAVVEGETTPLCADCFHDSTFICPDCNDRFWQCDGVRIFVSPLLWCRPCADAKDDAINRSWQQVRDEHKDHFHQVRRG